MNSVMKKYFSVLLLFTSITTMVFSVYHNFHITNKKQSIDGKICVLENQESLIYSNSHKINIKLNPSIFSSQFVFKNCFNHYFEVFKNRIIGIKFRQTPHFDFLIKLRKIDLTFPFHSYW